MEERSARLNLRPCTVTWVVLVGLTLGVLSIGRLGLDGWGITGLLLVSMLVKTWLVAEYFMGLRASALRWRLIMAAYLVVVLSGIALAWWLASPTGS